jgi:acyl-CoA synthetase (AMP-forming)/AMP-acid ligase II
VPETIPEALARAVARHADREALVTPDERLTYRDLGARVEAAAAALVGRGVEHGDRVAIWAPNSAEWAVASLAIHGIGAVLVPVNTRFKGAEARYVLQSAEARLLLTVTDFLDTDYPALLAAAGIPAGLDVVELGALHEGVAAASSGTVAERAAAVTGGDLTEIMFTSGTTGRPKGAMLTHGATIREPVLPHVRAEGRHPFVRVDRRHDRADGHARPLRGSGDDRAGADHHTARRADALPDPARPSRS